MEATIAARREEDLAIFGLGRQLQLEEARKERSADQEKAYHQRVYRETATKIQRKHLATGGKPLSKVSLAHLVKKELELEESEETIRAALKNQRI